MHLLIYTNDFHNNKLCKLFLQIIFRKIDKVKLRIYYVADTMHICKQITYYFTNK